MKDLSGLSRLYELGQYVFLKGGMLKEDFLLYASAKYGNGKPTKSSYSQGQRALKKLHDDRGFVEYKEIYLGSKYKGKKKAITVCISKRGYQYYSQYLSPNSVVLAKKMYDIVSKNDQKKLEKLYTQNHVCSMFEAVGIETSGYLSGISLEKLYDFRRASDEYKNQNKNKYIYSRHIEGVYYSSTEFINFYQAKYKDSEIFSSVFRGLFLSNDKCIVVYSNVKNNNNMIYVRDAERENRLIKKLKYIFNYKEIYALTFSDTESFIWSTVEGRKRGRRKDNERNSNQPDNVLCLSRVLEEEIKFDKFYCVVNGKEGLKTLKQILTYDEDVELAHCAEMSKNIKIAERGAAAPLGYHYKGMWHACYYLPFYELIELAKIVELTNSWVGSNEPPTIITYPELRETIQHITHKQHLFIDADTYRPLSKIDSTIYDSNGNPKGLKMLLDYLHEQGVTIPPKVIRELPKSYNKDYIEFYNYIALSREGYSYEDIADKLIADDKTIPYTDKHTKHLKKKTMKVSYDAHNRVKKYADKKGWKLYYALNEIIINALPDD